MKNIHTPAHILRLDPLVGDTACHLHCIHLLHLYYKMLQNSLGDKDKEHLEACVILTAVSKPNYDINQLKIGETTDPEQVPAHLWPVEIAKKKAAAKNRYLSSIRAFVTLHNFSFLHEILNAYPMFYGEYQKYLPRLLEGKEKLLYPLYIGACEQKLPILPAYLTGKIFLYFLMYSHSVLLVDLIRFKTKESINPEKPLHAQREVVSRHQIPYQWDAEQRTLLPQPNEILTQGLPVVVLTMYSYLLKPNSGVEPCFEDPNSETFLTEFKKLDFPFLFLVYMAGHISIPSGNSVKSECGLLEECRTEFLTFEYGPLERIFIDPTQCSKKEFEALARYALRYGIFCHSTPDYKNSQQFPVAYGLSHVTSEITCGR